MRYSLKIAASVLAVASFIFAAPVDAQSSWGAASSAGSFGPRVGEGEHDWSGPYAGLHLGHGFGSSDWYFPNAASMTDHNMKGAVGGIHGGYNFQNGTMVYGPEADLSFANVHGASLCPNPAFTCETELNYLGSLRGRIGCTQGAFLPFITAGIAFGSVDPIALQTGNDFDAPHQTHVGYVIGGGVEYWAAMRGSAKISTRIEALHYDLGEKDYNLTNAANTVNLVSIGVKTTVVRLGVTFHF